MLFTSKVKVFFKSCYVSSYRPYFHYRSNLTTTCPGHISPQKLSLFFRTIKIFCIVNIIFMTSSIFSNQILNYPDGYYFSVLPLWYNDFLFIKLQKLNYTIQYNKHFYACIYFICCPIYSLNRNLYLCLQYSNEMHNKNNNNFSFDFKPNWFESDPDMF